MEKTTINQRIKMLVDELDEGNKLAFSKRVGMSNQGLGEIIGERQSSPSYPKLEKMLRSLPQVRMEWLLLGEGEMLKSTTTPNTTAFLKEHEHSVANQPTHVIEAISAPIPHANYSEQLSIAFHNVKNSGLQVLTRGHTPDGNEIMEWISIEDIGNLIFPSQE